MALKQIAQLSDDERQLEISTETTTSVFLREKKSLKSIIPFDGVQPKEEIMLDFLSSVC